MAPRSVTIQLAPGISYATLPDHRKMVSGVQYDIDWETFQKLSPQARQSYIQVVTVNGGPASVSTFPATTLLPDQTSNANPQLNIWGLLTTATATPFVNTGSIGVGGLNLSGKAFQGWTAVQGAPGQINNINVVNVSLTGPQDEKYTYIYNADSNSLNPGDVAVWSSGGSSGRQVQQAHLAANAINYTSGYGVFAGIALTTIPSGYYGWIQVEGECAVVNVDSTVVAGDPLWPSTATAGRASASNSGAPGSTGSATFGVFSDITTGTLVTKPVIPFGTALNAASSNKAPVHIRSFRSKKPYKRFSNHN